MKQVGKYIFEDGTGRVWGVHAMRERIAELENGFYPCPFEADREGREKWHEFVQALMKDDFAIGDTLWLGDWKFEVVAGGPDDE